MENVGPLLPTIHELVSTLTASQINSLARLLDRAGEPAWVRLRYDLLGLHLHEKGQNLLMEMLSRWQRLESPPIPSLVAAALLSASYTFHARQAAQSLELVWTGPEPAIARLRRTEQALVELIQSAQERILIVSFAVYRADEVIAALVAARQRGVSLHICIESPEASDGEMAYDTVAALGSDLRRGAAIYTWPWARRAMDVSGRRGSLHAKCAVADGRILFLSSANLTGYAMNLNMELGILIRGGPQPGKVDGYFRQLMEMGILQRVE